MDKMYYVTATDKTWKNSKMVMVCRTYEQAREWFNKWDCRSDLSYVNIRYTKPYYSNKQVSYYNGEDGSLMESLRSEICIAQIVAGLRRVGYRH